MQMENIRSVVINKRLIEKILIAFLALQPILDLYFLFDQEVVDFFGFSPSTIVRIGFVGVIGILFLFIIKNKKEIFAYSAYLTLVFIYVVLHHINAMNFTDFYDGYDFGYTLVSELFYIIRMLMPLFIIIVSAHFEFSDKTIENLVTLLIVLISGSIVVTNLLGISTGSYSKEIIEGNIFYWFMEDRGGIGFMGLASKGLFLDPNRLSALLVLLTPITFYVLFKNPSVKNMIVIIINLFGMFMLGTKVSTYGCLIIFVLSIFIYFFFSLVKKEVKSKFSVALFLILIAIGYILIYPYCPAVNRTEVDNSIYEEYNSNKDNKLENNKLAMDELNQQLIAESGLEVEISDIEDVEEILATMPEDKKKIILMNFIETNYQQYSLHYHFVFDSYPYGYDPEFWYDVMNLEIDERMNFRLIEKMMLERVKEKNDNSLDDWLGITFTRMGNIFDLERDFVSHYYTLGILGLIVFLLPYLIVVVVSIVRILIRFRDVCKMKNIFYLLSVGIVVFAAYFTGNVMDGLVVTLILGFVIGQLINGTFFVGNTFSNEFKENNN